MSNHNTSRFQHYQFSSSIGKFITIHVNWADCRHLFSIWTFFSIFSLATRLAEHVFWFYFRLFFFFTIFLHNVLRPALLTGFRILFVLFNLLRRRKTDRPVDRIATSKRGVYVHTYIYNVSQPRSRLHYNLKLIASHSTVDLENENRWMWVFLHVYPALGHCLALFLLLFVVFCAISVAAIVSDRF